MKHLLNSRLDFQGLDLVVLSAAQSKVRAQYPDPEHWAALVMVDGI